MAPRSLPNAITLTRLASVPAVVWLTYSRNTGAIVAAASLFVLAVASDWLDGHLARRLRLQSAFGTLMDPLVDKVMVLCLLFAFADRGMVPTWLALLNMAREFAVTAVRHTISSRAEPVGANWMGKTKFCLQTAFVVVAYVCLALDSAGRPMPGAAGILFWSLLGITAVSYGFLLRFVLSHRARLTGGPGEQAGRSSP